MWVAHHKPKHQTRERAKRLFGRLFSAIAYAVHALFSQGREARVFMLIPCRREANGFSDRAYRSNAMALNDCPNPGEAGNVDV
jgi:hypothetical protein